MLKLTRPLVFFDLEATGKDPAKDRIVEFGAMRILPGGEARDVWTSRFNPEMPIAPGATEKHGITDEDVANSPKFAELAKLIHHAMTGCDLAGYNLLNYDIPLLWEEFHRAGYNWDLAGVRVVDAEKIFKKKEERTLGAAVLFFCGRQHDDAHTAGGDVLATRDVIEGQLKLYPDLAAMSLDQLAAYATLDDLPRVDLAGKLVRDKDGDAVYNFGKLKGQKLKDDPSFAEWMLRKDFTQNTLMHVREELGKNYCPDPMASWVGVGGV